MGPSLSIPDPLRLFDPLWQQCSQRGCDQLENSDHCDLSASSKLFKDLTAQDENNFLIPDDVKGRRYRQLRVLDVSGWNYYGGGRIDGVGVFAFLVRKNAKTLEELCAWGASDESYAAYFSTDNVNALLEELPRLRELQCDVMCTQAEALFMLKNEPPYGALRLRKVIVHKFDQEHFPVRMAEIIAAAAGHTTLRCLYFWGFDEVWSADVAEALADLAISQLRNLQFHHTWESDKTDHALERLCDAGEIQYLNKTGSHVLWERPCAACQQERYIRTAGNVHATHRDWSAAGFIYERTCPECRYS